MVLAAGLALLGLTAVPAHAQEARAAGVRVLEASLHERDTAVRLDAHLALALPEAVEQALRKGIPVIFVAQTRIVQSRWYWRDAILADTRRYYRLSYQPLTDRWRLGISAERPQAGGGLTFGQNFASLDEALNVLRRLGEWRIAARTDFASGEVYRVEFAFHLDVAQLPRLLQIGMSGQDDWRIAAQVDFRWTPEPPAPTPNPTAALADTPAAAPPAGQPASEGEGE
ncbi:MAG: DUF4390 domain-containing protein [Comamonas sp.]